MRTPAAPHNGTRTSRAAAEGVKPTQLQMVRDFLDAVGPKGATREQIHLGTGLKESAVCGRIDQLRKLGEIVEPNGMERKTSAGKAAQLIYLKPHWASVRGGVL